MRKSEVKHILKSEEKQKGEPVLVFDHYMNPHGDKSQPSTPEGWDNVKQLNECYFLAWQNGCEDDAAVYLGHFEKP